MEEQYKVFPLHHRHWCFHCGHWMEPGTIIRYWRGFYVTHDEDCSANRAPSGILWPVDEVPA